MSGIDARRPSTEVIEYESSGNRATRENIHIAMDENIAGLHIDKSIAELIVPAMPQPTLAILPHVRPQFIMA